jgi:hypothetical protein
MAVRPMPAATAHDAQLEAQAVRAVHGTRDFAGTDVVSDSDKILDARIVSDFDVEQNELTGVPTKRSVDIALAIQAADGKCRWVKVLFTQQHMGGGTYGGLHGEVPLEQGAMECPAASATAADAGARAQPAAAGAPSTAVFVSASQPPPESEAEQQAQIDALVDGLGPNAASECKAYVRQACKAQPGSTRVAVCKAYADAVREIANTPEGASACKAMGGGSAP